MADARARAFRFHTLHPPYQLALPRSCSCSWVLLDLFPYIADRRNPTSAAALMSHGEELRVTLRASPPPLVSYVCVWCPGLAPAEIERASIEAAGSDLLLVHVTLRGADRRAEFFVYKAGTGGGAGKPPSLRPLAALPPPVCLCHRYNIGLLAHRDVAGDGDDGHCYVAALYCEAQTVDYNLWVYNSSDEKCVTLPISLPFDLLCHCTGKVIVLGQGGQLGFVDPWRGIVICDVFGRTPSRYLPLPKELIRHDMYADEALLFQDVVLVGRDSLSIVNLHHLVGPGTHDADCWTWQVSAWSRSVSDDEEDDDCVSDEEDDWYCDYLFQSGDILVDDDTYSVWLLPKMRDREGTMRPTVERLYVSHPMLSLSKSYVVYIMGKVVGDEDSKALVLSIDMRMPRLLEVAVFDAERMRGVFSYTCTQSTIPRYFNASTYA